MGETFFGRRRCLLPSPHPPRDFIPWIPETLGSVWFFVGGRRVRKVWTRRDLFLVKLCDRDLDSQSPVSFYVRGYSFKGSLLRELSAKLTEGVLKVTSQSPPRLVRGASVARRSRDGRSLAKDIHYLIARFC